MKISSPPLSAVAELLHIDQLSAATREVGWSTTATRHRLQGNRLVQAALFWLSHHTGQGQVGRRPAGRGCGPPNLRSQTAAVGRVSGRAAVVRQRAAAEGCVRSAAACDQRDTAGAAASRRPTDRPSPPEPVRGEEHPSGGRRRPSLQLRQRRAIARREDQCN